MRVRTSILRKAAVLGLIVGGTAVSASCASMGRYLDTRDNVDEEFKKQDEVALATRCAEDIDIKEMQQVAFYACEKFADLQAEKLRAAQSGGDFKTVASICSGETDPLVHPVTKAKLQGDMTMQVRDSFRKDGFQIEHAPREVKDASRIRQIACVMHAKNGDADAFAALAADVKACKDGNAFYDSHMAKFRKGGNEMTKRAFWVMADMAKCNQWDFMFEKLGHWGSEETGGALWGKLAEQGHDVEKLIKDYIDRNKKAPFAFKYGQHLGQNIAYYLASAKHFDKCEWYIPHYKKMPEEAQDAFLHYFAESKCMKAAPLALERLASNNARTRRQACAVLAHIGSKKDIPKLKVVAENDPTYKIEGFDVRVFWVRDECKAAIGKIQLR